MSSLWHSLRELLLPNSCLLCQQPVEEPLCPRCISELPRHANCQADYFALYDHQERMKKLIWHLKYDYRQRLALQLGRELGRELKETLELPADHYLLPVPLHPKRERERGYNQSRIIAQGVAEITGGRILTDLLKRKRYTKTQTTKDRTARTQNVRGVFEVIPGPEKELFYLVIDDVITSGATTREICQQLRAAGYLNCYAVSLASPNQKDKETQK